MDIRQIMSVLAVAKCRSFSDAAEQICFSQSAVSKQVNSLENELGVKLFERRTQSFSVLPTSVGEKVLQRLESIANEYNELCMMAKNLQIDETPPVTLGSAQAFGSFGEDVLCAEFYIRHPGIKLYHLLSNSTHLAELLRSVSIDCAVMAVGMVLWPTENFIRFVRENDCIAVPLLRCTTTVGLYKDHPLADRESVELSELKNETFIIKNYFDAPGKSFAPQKHEDFIACCQKAGFTPEVVGVDDYSNKIRLQMVKRGMGVMLNTSYITMEYEDIKFIPLKPYPHSFTSYFVALKKNESPTLAKLTKIAREMSRRANFEKDVFMV